MQGKEGIGLAIGQERLMSVHILACPNAAKLNPESYRAVAPSSQMKCQDRKLKGQTKACFCAVGAVSCASVFDLDPRILKAAKLQRAWPLLVLCDRREGTMTVHVSVA